MRSDGDGWSVKLTILYGGTFDPVHAGHLAVADAAATCFDVDVALLPAADPPHRPPPGADASQRATMLDLAVVGHPRLRVDRRELHRTGPSYTVDTLAQARSQLGVQAPLAWLLGADAFAGLPRWHRWRELFDLAHLIVASRPGHGLEALDPELRTATEHRWTTDPAALHRSPCARLFRLDLPLRPEAASDLRARIAAGDRWQDETPPAVAAYIGAQRLYQRHRLPS
ncbi:MAG: nicotinate-nucleotide adenylyltransferase [Proteobacteria bacterium]|nr:nicotinate-nucleotide adenylyltransferase [Pseudomonadota bacterium]MBS0461071.1 nicotinate-nucleotide adenylyltransferase [Pseudomonadota bacterium]MBS0464733.1 nicotinate-nucleotide adenylyltransferase [Pseudomonadota bacterium]